MLLYQVRKVWEVLLSARPQLQSGEGAELLRALVQARLVSNVTSTKRVAEGKRIIDFGQDVGFMMAKVSFFAGYLYSAEKQPQLSCFACGAWSSVALIINLHERASGVIGAEDSWTERRDANCAGWGGCGRGQCRGQGGCAQQGCGAAHGGAEVDVGIHTAPVLTERACCQLCDLHGGGSYIVSWLVGHGC